MPNLVLQRRVGQSIVIGNHITVTVVARIHGGVRLAVNAPADMAVNRKEIADRINAGTGYVRDPIEKKRP